MYFELWKKLPVHLQPCVFIIIIVVVRVSGVPLQSLLNAKANPQDEFTTTSEFCTSVVEVL